MHEVERYSAAAERGQDVMCVRRCGGVVESGRTVRFCCGTASEKGRTRRGRQRSAPPRGAEPSEVTVVKRARARALLVVVVVVMACRRETFDQRLLR